MHTRTTHIILTLLLASVFTAHGQDATMWRKNVSHMIISDTGKARHGGELFGSMKAGILSNKIKAYNHYDYTFTELTKEEIKYTFSHPPDTMFVNATTAEEAIRIAVHDLYSDSIYQYRLLENWKYDPITCKTQLQINAIAPILTIYGEAGEFRGRKPLFWLMYDALNNLLSTNPQQLQQLDRLTSLAWADFFEAYSASPALPPKHLLATRTISVYEEEDTVYHHLADETSDTLLSEVLIEAAQQNKITAWDTADYTLKTKMPVNEITKMITPKPDTVVVDDPVTGTETIKIVLHDFNYGTINTYKILEDWSFDPATGKIETKVLAIAPLQYLLDDTGAWKETRTMCWLRYDDVKNIIRKYEEYHPINTIAQQIWNSYFLWDIKPEIVK